MPAPLEQCPQSECAELKFCIIRQIIEPQLTYGMQPDGKWHPDELLAYLQNSLDRMDTDGCAMKPENQEFIEGIRFVINKLYPPSPDA